MKTIEQELKYQLNSQDFIKFLNHLDTHYERLESYSQTNYYLDTKNMKLKNTNMSFRIRNINNEVFECTIKVPLKNSGANVHIKEEITIPITKEIAQSIIKDKNLIKFELQLKPIIEVINQYIDINDICTIGQLKTERSYYLICQEMEPINIDRNCYFDVLDYEVEWETSNVSKADEILSSIFTKLNITPLTSTASKSSRFFKVYKHQNHDNLG